MFALLPTPGSSCPSCAERKKPGRRWRLRAQRSKGQTSASGAQLRPSWLTFRFGLRCSTRLGLRSLAVTLAHEAGDDPADEPTYPVGQWRSQQEAANQLPRLRIEIADHPQHEPVENRKRQENGNANAGTVATSQDALRTPVGNRQ